MRYIKFSRRTRLFYNKYFSEQCIGLDDKRPVFLDSIHATVAEKIEWGLVRPSVIDSLVVLLSFSLFSACFW